MIAILYIGLSQFLFAALLTLTKRRRKLPDMILGLWLLLMCIFMGLTLAKNELPEGFWGSLQLFPFFFTVGPFLYLYVKSLAAEKRRLDFADSLHLLPFAIFSTVAVLRPHTVDENILEGKILHTEMLIYSGSAILSIFFYLIRTFVLLNRHDQKILNHFSYHSRKISLFWVRLVTIIFSVTLSVTVILTIVNFFTGEPSVNPGVALFLGFTLFGYGVTYYGVRQPVIFTEEKKSTDERFEDPLEEDAGEDVEEVSNDELDSGKYARSGLQKEQAEGYVKILLAYMEAEQPYLRRDLTIQEVAQEINIPQHHLTQTINEILEKNFYVFVNEYRIDEVKLRLKSPKYNHLTVLAIAHDAGFNSKSSFNMTFKKYVGMTPSEYKRKAQKG